MMVGEYHWDNWMDRLLMKMRWPKVIFYPKDGDDSRWTIAGTADLMPGAIIYSGKGLGGRTVIADGALVAPYAQVRENSTIAQNAKVGAKVNIEWEVFVGRKTKIQGLSMISEKTHIGENVFIAMGVNMMTDKYMDGSSLNPVIIEDNVRIGGGVSLLPGTRVGHHSIIGAGCVISGEIEPYSVIYAKAVKGALVRKIEEPRVD